MTSFALPSTVVKFFKLSCQKDLSEHFLKEFPGHSDHHSEQLPNRLFIWCTVGTDVTDDADVLVLHAWCCRGWYCCLTINRFQAQSLGQLGTFLYSPVRLCGLSQGSLAKANTYL